MRNLWDLGLAIVLCLASAAAWADGWPLTSPSDTPAPGQPTTPLFIVHTQNNAPGAGDWISSNAGGATHYSYFIEVPPSTTNLIVEIFDPDVRQGGSGEGSASSLPHYDQQRGSETVTATNYLLINPAGATVQTINGTNSNPAASHATWFGFATVASPANGHWEVRVDSLLVAGSGNVSGYGLRARATVNGAPNTQLRVYADAHLSVQNYGVNTLYVAHPYVTGHCQVRVRDYDADADVGDIGNASSIRLESSAPSLVGQTFSGAQLSGNGNGWAANDTSIGWHSDQAVIRPGIYTTEIRARSTSATNEFQVGFFNPNGFGNLVNPTVPAAGDTWLNSWRTYLPTPTSPVTARGTAPAKPYLTQRLFHAGDGSPNPPGVSQTGNYDVVIQMVNPTAYPISFSATDLVRSHVPGGQVLRAATPISTSQGSIVSQPAFPGGSGFIEWNPGTVAAGQTVTMAYRVAVTPTALGRIAVTGTPAANGTTARYLDETANASQARATYTWGPLCELAATAGGSSVPTPATLAKVSSQRTGAQLIIDLRTAVQVGVAYYEVLEPATDGSGWKAVDGSQTPAPLDHLDAASIRLQVRTNAEQFMLRSVDIDGRSMLHGPFQSGAAIGAEPDSRAIPWTQIRAELAAFNASIRGAGPQATSFDLQVQRGGIARLRFEDLPDADWSGVSVAGLGLYDRDVPVPIRVISADGLFGPGDALEFIADDPEGVYSATRVYQLRKDQPQPARVSERRAIVEVNGLPDMRVEQTELIDDDLLYNFSSPLQDPWQADRLLSTPSAPLTRNYLLRVEPSQVGDVSLTGTLLGGIDWGDDELDHSVQISVNGVMVQTVNFDALEVSLFDFVLPAGVIQDGDNTVSLTLPAPQRTDIVWLERIGLRYQGDPPVSNGTGRFKSVPGDYADFPPADQLLGADFESAAPLDACIGTDGANFCLALTVADIEAATTRIYRREADGSVQTLLSPAPTANGIRWAEPPALGREIVVADDSGLVAVSASVSAPAAALSGPAELLIIAHPLFVDGVEALANRRRAQGLSVQTIATTAAYARYSGGHFDPQAIDRLIDDAANSHGTRYVLLVGADSYDYQDRLGIGSVSFLPSHYVRVHPVVHHAPTDGLYADIDDDQRADIAIGRLPVRTVAELEQVLQKIVAYESSGAAAPALFIADDADPSGATFGDRSELLRARLSGASQTAYLDEVSATEARQRLLSAATAGADMIHFLGHSSPSTWTFPAPGLITPSELFAGALSSAVRPTVVTQWGCWNSYLAAPGNDSLGHAWLLGPGAAVAVIGATSLTEVDHDVFLSYRLLDRWSGAEARLGDALLQAKQDLAESDPQAVDVLLGTTLFGDPTLQRQP